MPVNLAIIKAGMLKSLWRASPFTASPDGIWGK